VPVDAADGRSTTAPAIAGLDLAANAESLGATVIRCGDVAEVRTALSAAREVHDGPVVIHVEVDRYAGVPSYDGWWDVPVAAVSDSPDVQAARAEYEQALRSQRAHVTPAEAAR
jgi:3D-(3,5/4)-trihydroxycyclohexane-1,2-dione acylhydrolase (decyclizing)